MKSKSKSRKAMPVKTARAATPAVQQDWSAVRFITLQDQVSALHEELKSAVARKPSAVLQALAYQLKATREEMAMVQEELAKMNRRLEQFVTALPTPRGQFPGFEYHAAQPLEVKG